MRRLLAGIFLAALLFPTAALLAETRGEVEAIGFGSHYRPNCYVPMLVRVQADKSGTYQIRVIQDDLDADQPSFTQVVSLTGSEEGGSRSEQRFWVYFLPQPTDGGLPDVSDGLRALQQTLKVFLCDESGRQLVQLPVTGTIQNLDQTQVGPTGARRGAKMVLAVADGANQPVWRDYQQAMGTMEDVAFVPLRATDLPEDARGYEMVDAIVWLNAPAPDPAKAAEEKRYHALREWVRDGGHLVICQPPQRDATANFDDLLPVEVKEIAPRDNLEPLRTIATSKLPPRGTRDEFGALRGPALDDWELPKPPFSFARAQLKKGARADEMLTWGPDSAPSPYIARGGYGAGCVTWVAHDLSDPAITTRAKSGWPYVWDRVLDYRHDLLIIDQRTLEETKRPYAPGSSMDLGAALLRGMQLSAKSKILVTIAVVFFIGYWVVAGPGVYLYLLTKSRPQLSWFMFAFSALVATVLTVLVVRLVVRGPPELSHVTVVRSSPDAPTLSLSRFGLYIPQSSDQEIALPQVEPRAVSYLTAYPAHPSHMAGSIDFPAHKPYVVPTRDASAEEPVELVVPYRSTMKQFQARRVGSVAGLIEGKPKLRETEGSIFKLEGTLFNATGQRLKNVYLAYNEPSRSGDVGDDYILFLPIWEKSQSIDLAAEFGRDARFIKSAGLSGGMYAAPDEGYNIRDVLGRPGQDIGWTSFWYSGQLRSGGYGNGSVDDLHTRVSRSFPMLSLFGRLPPMRNPIGRQPDRTELVRRGGRNFDVSAAVAAGRLVVLAEAAGDDRQASGGNAPLPFDLEVEGDKVAGKGYLFFQTVLDLERIDLPPSTQPATTQSSPDEAVEPQRPVEPPEAPPLTGASPTGPPPFDPATYNGPLNALAPDQRRQVMQFRREESKRQREQREQQLPNVLPR